MDGLMAPCHSLSECAMPQGLPSHASCPAMPAQLALPAHAQPSSFRHTVHTGGEVFFSAMFYATANHANTGMKERLCLAYTATEFLQMPCLGCVFFCWHTLHTKMPCMLRLPVLAEEAFLCCALTTGWSPETDSACLPMPFPQPQAWLHATHLTLFGPWQHTPRRMRGCQCFQHAGKMFVSMSRYAAPWHYIRSGTAQCYPTPCHMLLHQRRDDGDA